MSDQPTSIRPARSFSLEERRKIVAEARLAAAELLRKINYLADLEAYEHAEGQGDNADSGSADTS